MARPYSEQTKENFENHAMPVGRYIILRYHSSYFLPSNIDLIVRLDNSLITTVISFIYISLVYN